MTGAFVRRGNQVGQVLWVEPKGAARCGCLCRLPHYARLSVAPAAAAAAAATWCTMRCLDILCQRSRPAVYAGMLCKSAPASQAPQQAKLQAHCVLAIDKLCVQLPSAPRGLAGRHPPGTVAGRCAQAAHGRRGAACTEGTACRYAALAADVLQCALEAVGCAGCSVRGHR